MSEIDIDQVYTHIRRLGNNTAIFEDSSGWGHKQDLYRIKELVDLTIQNCPIFPKEQEWLTDQEKKRIINILSN
jgi:hypothetical protein